MTRTLSPRTIPVMAVAPAGESVCAKVSNASQTILVLQRPPVRSLWLGRQESRGVLTHLPLMELSAHPSEEPPSVQSMYASKVNVFHWVLCKATMPINC